MGTDDSLEVLVVPKFLVEEGHFFQQFIMEPFRQQHMLSERGNDIEHLQHTIGIIGQP